MFGHVFQQSKRAANSQQIGANGMLCKTLNVG
jgi:hypothetical protein